WSTSLGDLVSYPLIAEGKVFVAVRNGWIAGARLYALDAATGAIAWGPVEVDGGLYRATTAYDAGRVFALNYEGLLRAYAAGDGALVWSRYVTGSGSAGGFLPLV